MEREALLLVDIQNDFLPGGALAVPHGDQVVPLARRLVALAPLVFATQDWHPHNHGSFADNQIGHEAGEVIQWNGQPQMLWPVHCVQRSSGARIAEGIDQAAIAFVATKGEDPEVDSYSGFFDNGRQRQTQLHRELQSLGVERLFVCGLATEYCVKFTVLDALELGYSTFLVEDACRGLAAVDARAAIEEMTSAGAKLTRTAELAEHRWKPGA